MAVSLRKAIFKRNFSFEGQAVYLSWWLSQTKRHATGHCSVLKC